MQEHIYILTSQNNYFLGAFASLQRAQEEGEKKKKYKQDFDYKITLQSIQN